MLGRKPKEWHRGNEAHKKIVTQAEGWFKDVRKVRADLTTALKAAWENQDIGIAPLSSNDLAAASKLASLKSEDLGKVKLKISPEQARRIQNFEDKFEQRFGTKNMFLKQTENAHNYKILKVRQGLLRNAPIIDHVRGAANTIEKLKALGLSKGKGLGL